MDITDSENYINVDYEFILGVYNGYIGVYQDEYEFGSWANSTWGNFHKLMVF